MRTPALGAARGEVGLRRKLGSIAGCAGPGFPGVSPTRIASLASAPADACQHPRVSPVRLISSSVVSANAGAEKDSTIATDARTRPPAAGVISPSFIRHLQPPGIPQRCPSWSGGVSVSHRLERCGTTRRRIAASSGHTHCTTGRAGRAMRKTRYFPETIGPPSWVLSLVSDRLSSEAAAAALADW